MMDKATFIIKIDGDIQNYHFQRIGMIATFNAVQNKPPILFEPCAALLIYWQRGFFCPQHL